jgi:IS5 family transposase
MKPRTYRREARKNYLALAKSKKRSAKKIRKTIRKQLGYVRRDMGYLEQYMSEGYALTSKEIKLFLTIQKLYEQQEYMYKNKTHSVENRIVSIERPYLRPIVRGKVKAPVEFGAKFDLSIDSSGYGRIEKISFDAYNESTCLVNAVERFKERTGYYPERVLADQIYRTRGNRAYCKLHGIRLSGPKLGRPTVTSKSDKKQEYQDNTDRIEVERAFSLSKRCYGLGLIKTKLEETTLTSIALSVFVTNLFKIQSRILFVLFLLLGILKFNTAELSPKEA